MSKLIVKENLEIYKKRQQGITIFSLSQKYNVHDANLKYLIRLIKLHGYGAVERKNNRYYSPDLKEEIINQLLVNGQSISRTAIEYGLFVNCKVKLDRVAIN